MQHAINPNLLTVSGFTDKHSWATNGGLRHLIFNAHSNGYADAFKRIGRRVLIDESAFFDCMEKQNGRAAQ